MSFKKKEAEQFDNDERQVPFDCDDYDFANGEDLDLDTLKLSKPFDENGNKIIVGEVDDKFGTHYKFKASLLSFELSF